MSIYKLYWPLESKIYEQNVQNSENEIHNMINDDVANVMIASVG